MRSIRMIHVCLFCLVDKDDSTYNAANSCKRLCLFYFSDYVAFIVFTKLELVIVCFFLVWQTLWKLLFA
ncbi:hypothetical protein HanRHA438_Chr16g0742751 [Helianthus annuus]|nr:hypothetical protein HanRHA438_Chr16g0742751 [Helianthus annuus]